VRDVASATIDDASVDVVAASIWAAASATIVASDVVASATDTCALPVRAPELYRSQLRWLHAVPPALQIIMQCLPDIAW